MASGGFGPADTMANMRNGIPTFSATGAVLTPEEQANIARRKGLCLRCGRKTHKVKFLGKEPLTNENVFNGICLVCFPEKRPTATVSAVSDRAQSAGSVGSQNSAAPAQPQRRGNRRFRAAADAAIATTTGHRAQHPASAASTPVSRPPPSTSQPTPPATSGDGGSDDSDGSIDLDAAVMGDSTRSNASSGNEIQASSTLVGSGGSAHLSGRSEHRSLRSSNGSRSLSGTQTGGGEMLDDVDDYRDQAGVPNGDDAWDVVKVMRDNPRDSALLRQKCHQLRNIGNNQAGSLYEINDVMVRHRKNAKLMAAACGAVWGVTAENDDMKSEANEVAKVIVERMKSMPGDAHFIEWACGALACLSRGIGNKEEIADADGIQVMVDALRDHRDSPGVFEWACRALHSMVHRYDDDGSSDDDNKEEIVAISKNVVAIEGAGAIPVLLHAMKQHSSEAIPQEWALKLLWRLEDREDVADSTRVLQKIRDGEGINVCVKVMKESSPTASLLEMASLMLYQLLEGASADDETYRVASGCISSVMRAMKEHTTKETVVEACCSLLATLASFGDENKTSINEGCVRSGMLVNAMDSFLACASVQESACWILWSLSEKVSSVDSACFEEAIVAVNKSVKQHPLSAMVQTAACGMWANLALSNAIDVRGVRLGAVIDAMKAHSDDELMREQACRAIAHLCKEDAKLANDVIEADGIAPLVEAMGSSSPKVQEEASLALCVVSATRDTSKKAAISASNLEDILRTVGSNPNASSLQIIALDTLSMLAVSLGKEVRSLPESTVPVITQTMDRHPRNTTLQLSACVALRNLLVAPASRTMSYSVDGLINTIVQSMRSLQNEVHFLTEACGVLWALTGRTFTKSVPTVTSAFRAILETMNLYNGDSHPYDGDLHFEALGALQGVSAYFDQTPVRLTPQDLDVILSIMYRTMESDPSRTDIFEKVLCVISNTSKLPENEDTIIQCGGIVAVIDAMVENEGVEAVQEQGCSILSVLSTENLEVKLCIAETDGVDMIISSMVSFDKNHRIQIEACTTLSHLSVDRESRMLIASQGGIMLIVNAMKNLLEDPELQEKACSALCNLASDANEQVLAEADVIVTVIDSMRYHPDQPKVQEKGLGVLQNLSMRSTNTKLVIASKGGVEVIATAIRENMGTPAVLERAFTTMWSLAVLDRNQVRIADAGGVRLVVNGMMANISVVKVQKQACGCLCTLSSNSGNKALIRDEGGIDAIVFAMWAHFDSEVLQTEACRALSSLAVNAQGNEVTMASENLINAILTAMRYFPNSTKLQEHACLALRNFSLSPANASIIRQSSAQVQELLNKAASRFPSQCADRANQVLAQIM